MMSRLFQPLFSCQSCRCQVPTTLTGKKVEIEIENPPTIPWFTTVQPTKPSGSSILLGEAAKIVFFLMAVPLMRG